MIGLGIHKICNVSKQKEMSDDSDDNFEVYNPFFNAWLKFNYPILFDKII